MRQVNYQLYSIQRDLQSPQTFADPNEPNYSAAQKVSRESSAKVADSEQGRFRYTLQIARYPVQPRRRVLGAEREPARLPKLAVDVDLVKRDAEYSEREPAH